MMKKLMFLLCVSLLIHNLYAQTENHPAEPEMVFVQGGTFTMGCTAEQDDDCADNEKPSHHVTISDFYIGKYEITQAQWVAVMGNNPSRFKGDVLPVEYVSWDDIRKFIRELNNLTGKKYRLPTEAEWEYAARGGNASQEYKYSGSNNVEDVAWYSGNSENKTHPVGTKTPNELNIYDMSGNVWEWCSNRYGEYFDEAQIDPEGPSTGSFRMLRGGSYYGDDTKTRVSTRDYTTPDSRGRSVGFRLAYDPEPVEEINSLEEELVEL